MMQSMLTTTDNPYDPFDEWDEWDAWDRAHGYHTNHYLARVIATSHELSPVDEDLSYEQAIDEILEFNVTGTYVKVTREVSETSEVS